MLRASFSVGRTRLSLAVMIVAVTTISCTNDAQAEKHVAKGGENALEQRQQPAKGEAQRAQGEGERTQVAAAPPGNDEPAASQREQTDEVKRDAFRVCADPNNLPFSNQNKQGYENEIAELMAKDLGLPVEYYWVPFQMGYDRIGLKGWNEQENHFNCDIVMGTTSLEVGETTKPYYASTYMLVYPKGGPLGDLQSSQQLVDKAMNDRTLQIGAFDMGPGAAWLQAKGLLAQLEPYRSQSGSRKVTPARIVKDVADGKIDAALVWGPIAGYYADKYKDANLEVLPLTSGNEVPGLRFDYGISMGMRYGEDEWMQTIERLLAQNKDQIHEILAEYNVPLVKIPKQDLVQEDDDD
jgi:mxaJ protein